MFDPEEVADELLAAYVTKRPIEPLAERFPGLTVRDAYDVQQRQAKRRCDQGETVVGRKIGLTSRPIRETFGVDVPDFGHLFDSMWCQTDDDIPVSRFIQPRVEPEVAFILERDLIGPGVTHVDAARAVAFCLPAIEIIDSRIADWKISICDTIADNGSSGAFVLGDSPKRINDVNLRLIGCVLTKNRKVVETGAGAAVLGSPLNALVWLANALGEEAALTAGSIVMSGSITGALPVEVGDLFVTELDGLGRVSAYFC
ncbi:MAG TPA: fumarylacetoacetate hydrolase family protein [Acidimicrobiales bacterium]|nr:fumarylacetoacetate hydrolase family protein [Acidimicrobiales bacterium]